MLSEGLLPLKRVVLFLAMSLPVQCMSFLWSWSSIRSASSPVHQNKYLCCCHQMAELMWLEAGAGGQQWLELWEQARPSHSAVSAVTAHLYCFMGCLGSVILWVFLREELWTVLKQKSPEAEPRTGLMGGLSLPQKHLFRDLSLFMFAAMGPESGCSARGCLPAAQAGGGAVLRQCCVIRPWPSCGSACVQESHGSSAVALAGTASTWVSFVLFSMPGFG